MKKKFLEKEQYKNELERYDKDNVKEAKFGEIKTELFATRDYFTKSERERQISYDITYIWNLKYDTNEPLKQNQRPREQTCGGERVSGGMDQELGVSKCKLLYVEQINTQTLLYSTENYIQYPMISHNGKEYLKKNMCV